MELKFNQYVGKPPRQKEDNINIYAFLFKDEVSIDLIGINYPISDVERRVLDMRIERTNLSKEQLYNENFMIAFRKANLPISKVHLIFSRSTKRLMQTDENDSKDHSYLIETVKNWLVKYPGIHEVGSVSEIDSDTKVSHWPHRSYFAAPLWTFKGIKRFISEEQMGKTANFWVVAYDSRDPGIVSEIEKQVSPSYGGAGSFKDSVNKDQIFVSNYDVVLNNEIISSPIILLNKKGKSEFDLEKSLFLFLVDFLDISESVRMTSQLKQQQYLGYDIQDLFYFNFGSQEKINMFSSSFDSITEPEKRESFMKKLEGLGVDLNDSESIKFAKTLSIYLRAFPSSDTNSHYKVFYSVVSVPAGKPPYPESPVMKNEGLFNAYFALNEGPVESGGRLFYLISSKFCFPKSVFKIFNPDPKLDLHEIFEFNSKNGMLSKYCFVDNAPKDKVTNFGYQSKVVTPFVGSMKDILGDRITDNRFNERLSVRRLSEFPYVLERLKAAFKREDVELKDVNVIFVYDPYNANTLGGYDCKRIRNEENVKLVEEYAAFPLPLMMFNLANSKIQRREDLSGTMIHEGKHYLDDMRFEKKEEAMKKSDPDSDAATSEAASFFDTSYSLERDQKKRFEKYLRSNHETSAFAEDALNVLRHYSLEYIYANWLFLKTRIIHEYFNQQENLNHYALPQNLMEVYSIILEQALDLYEQEENGENPKTK